ncbi:MAG: hypothetical protein Ct9H300mP19_09560 [Dehalococcoidia bacterium]|nr:MAG: hypothetical protein Ct9H300mP19_09560 [Dehalococcoidia bacterium]
MSVRILEAVRDLPKVCEMINLPFQAGRYDIGQHATRIYGQAVPQKITQIKDMIPGVTLTTDLIVGFSGESDEQFERSMDVLRYVEFEKVHVSEYSYREGTFASRKMKDDIDRSFKKARKAAVGELQEEIQTRNNPRMVGSRFDVLVEGRKRGRLHGRSRGDKLVYLNTTSDPISQEPGSVRRLRLK